MIKKLSVSVLCLLSLNLFAEEPMNAEQMYNHLDSRTQNAVAKLGAQFSYTKSPSIQADLLFEDLEWLDSMDLNSKTQHAAIVYVTLWLAEKNAAIEYGDTSKEPEELAMIYSFLKKIPAVQRNWKEKCRGIKVVDLEKIRGNF